MNATGVGGAKPGEARNPSGRPKGAVKFRLYAEKKTKTGKSLIDFWDAVARNEEAPFKDRLKATELLAGYAFGKPTQGVMVSTENGEPLAFNVTLNSGEHPKNGVEPDAGSNGFGLHYGNGNGSGG